MPIYMLKNAHTTSGFLEDETNVHKARHSPHLWPQFNSLSLPGGCSKVFTYYASIMLNSKKYANMFKFCKVVFILQFHNLLVVCDCRSLENALSAPFMAGSTMERRATAPRYLTPRERFPVRPRSRSGRPWISMASSWCGMMQKAGNQAGSLKILSRVGSGRTMATQPISSILTYRLGPGSVKPISSPIHLNIQRNLLCELMNGLILKREGKPLLPFTNMWQDFGKGSISRKSYWYSGIALIDKYSFSVRQLKTAIFKLIFCVKCPNPVTYFEPT